MPLHLEAGVEPIAGYILVRPLGRGGFGEVWEAIAPGGIRVALKFVHLESKEAGVEQRALEIIRDIRHPHLLDVQFATRVEDCLVIAMPLCDQSLMDRLHACKAEGLPGLPRDELLVYMEELARAVDFLNEPHQQVSGEVRSGVQHRDIKPHNIFLVGGSVRLADFGLAKVLEADTASHTGCMSPTYVAPEVLTGRVSQRSDQYSLAITYVQLRIGRPPFTGKSVDQILYDHLSSVPDLSMLPEEEGRVVARALAKQPEDRWPTCRAFVLGLATAARTSDAQLSFPDGTTLLAVEPTTDVATRLPGSPEPATVTDTLFDDRNPSNVQATATPSASLRRLRWIGLAALAASLVVLAGLTLLPRFGPPPSDPDDEPIEVAAKAEPVEQPARFLPPVAARVDTSGRPALIEPAHDRPRPDPVSVPAPVRDESPAPEPARPPAHAEVSDLELAPHTHALFKKYCYRCHGVRFEVPGFDVLDRDLLLAKRGDEEPTYVVPGRPDASYLWERVGVDRDMPPSGPKPSDEERALIARWIEAGAVFPEFNRAALPLRTERDVLAAIGDHLHRAHPRDRPFLRYFSLHNLYNNKNVDDANLRLARAGVAKLINSLSWEPKIVVPRSIDREEVVLAIDLRDLGWDERDLWQEILIRYPYGLKHDRDPEAEARVLAEDVYEMVGTALPFVRADWFVATASRPPLYHTLLDLPQDDRSLEKRLAVDVEAGLPDAELARARFAVGGASRPGRLVDRRQTPHGAYWKSHDLKTNEGKGPRLSVPLGPVIVNSPKPGQAFEHAGGEVLFNLPNGLQGYMLVDAQGRRIDEGPIEVVGDAPRTAGMAAVVPGLSCMACHQHGVIAFPDTLREGHAIAGDHQNTAQKLFLVQEAMNQFLAGDEGRFRQALDEATGAYLKVGEDRDKTSRDFPDPIGALARDYQKDLGPNEVAAELGLGDPKALAGMVRANPRLGEKGLAPLLRDAAIKRAHWDSLLEGRFNSRFQQVAGELELGSPFRVLEDLKP